MIIGIVGKSGAGKDTVAKIICKNLAFTKRIAFADALKSLLIKTGLSNREDLYVKKTAHSRRLMQIIGTDLVRNKIDKAFWIKKLDVKVNRCLLGGKIKHIVISDVRFKNEAEYIRSRGGWLFSVLRPTTAPKDSHSSETEQDLILTNWTLINDSSLSTLESNVLESGIIKFLKLGEVV